MKSFINGKASKLIPICDRGLLYGDGFFTTALVVQGEVLNWQGHWQRLQSSAFRLGFLPLSEKTLLRDIDAVLEVLSGALEGAMLVLKIVITRGCGGRGYQLPENTKPNIIIQLLDFPVNIANSELKPSDNYQVWYLSEVKATVCQTAWGHQPLLAGIKHLNRLENVMARTELGNNFDEGIMLDLDGIVISGTQSNICLIKNQQIITPVLNKSGVQGSLLVRLKSFLLLQGWKWLERPFNLSELKQADEVFFCNAVRGVMPMKQLDNNVWQTQQASQFHFAIMQLLMDETCKK